MDNILSTLKGEYSRTLLLIIIPGAIAFEPFALMMYSYYKVVFKDFPEQSLTAITIFYLLASIFAGFILQDVGSRMEMRYDKKFRVDKNISETQFNNQFQKYLFNKKEEDYIVTHYYRAMLVRMRFELHTCAAIAIMLIGSLIRVLYQQFVVDYSATMLFVGISSFVFFYLRKEAIDGVATLYQLREKINNHTF